MAYVSAHQVAKAAKVSLDAWLAFEERARFGDVQAAAIVADVYEELGDSETARYWRRFANVRPRKYAKRRLY